MKIFRNNVVNAILSIFILLVALAFAVINGIQPVDIWGNAQPISFWFHLLDFLTVLFAGFGLKYLVAGFLRRSSWLVFLSTCLLAPAMLCVFLRLYIDFWIILIILFFYISLMCILGRLICASKTEFAKNKEPDYKNYEQRKAEKEEKEASEPKEELPEIKSFK